MIHRLGGGKTGFLLCIGLVAAAGFGGFFAGVTAQRETGVAKPAELPATDTVSLRFPTEWADAAAPQETATYAFASADTNIVLFDPNPVYPTSAGKSAPTATGPSLNQSVSDQASAAAARPALAVASLAAKPAAAAPKPPVKRSNAVLSDQQIASIKRRLNLTPDQERYWPAVAAELRKMEYKKDAQGGKATAQVDMSKVNVAGLKSAGFPLVMSFNDDQRQELKSLAHLLGLENVLAGF